MTTDAARNRSHTASTTKNSKDPECTLCDGVCWSWDEFQWHVRSHTMGPNAIELGRVVNMEAQTVNEITTRFRRRPKTTSVVRRGRKHDLVIDRQDPADGDCKRCTTTSFERSRRRSSERTWGQSSRQCSRKRSKRVRSSRRRRGEDEEVGGDDTTVWRFGQQCCTGRDRWRMHQTKRRCSWTAPEQNSCPHTTNTDWRTDWRHAWLNGPSTRGPANSTRFQS